MKLSYLFLKLRILFELIQIFKRILIITYLKMLKKIKITY